MGQSAAHVGQNAELGPECSPVGQNAAPAGRMQPLLGKNAVPHFAHPHTTLLRTTCAQPAHNCGLHLKNNERITTAGPSEARPSQTGPCRRGAIQNAALVGQNVAPVRQKAAPVGHEPLLGQNAAPAGQNAALVGQDFASVNQNAVGGGKCRPCGPKCAAPSGQNEGPVVMMPLLSLTHAKPAHNPRTAPVGQNAALVGQIQPLWVRVQPL